MGVQLLSSDPTVQVIGQLTTDALFCTFVSTPSGSVLNRTIAQVDFQSGAGNSLLVSLSDAVEQILGEGIATAAVGTQAIDSTGLLADQVQFTVTYVPPYNTPGTIQGAVTVPVNVLTADTQFGSFLTGGSAADQIAAEYQRLKGLAGE